MKIRVGPHLRELTSLRLGGDARCMFLPESDDDYERIPGLAEHYGGQLLMLGRGTNILAEDGDHDLILVQRGCLSASEVVSTSPTQVLVRVDAGMSLARLLAWCIKHGCSGLEPLAGIPGSVGGAIAMNAGSHGQECFGLLREIRVWTPAAGVHQLEPRDCVAGYRHFSLRENAGVYAVLGAVFGFRPAPSEVIRELSRSWFMRKKSVQPLHAHTAGCVFKNPVDGSAGMLLDRAGFRGRACGGMRFSPMHANFLENTGSGTATQALELMDLAVHEVDVRFGVHLEREVEVLTCP